MSKKYKLKISKLPLQAISWQIYEAGIGELSNYATKKGRYHKTISKLNNEIKVP